MVLVFGDINIDVSGRLIESPRIGHDCLASELELHLGGVGANTAVAFSRWGMNPRLVASTGNDPFAELALQRLADAGVDTSFVQRTNTATGLMFLAISPEGERTIFGSRGANARAHRTEHVLAALKGAQALHLVGYDFLAAPAAELGDALLAKAKEKGLLTSLDVGSAPSRDLRDKMLALARQVDILFATRDEAEALTGRTGAAAALEALEAAGAKQVVLKLGAQGGLLRLNGKLEQAPCFAVQALDTTGSGDAFSAAFISARLRGLPDDAAALLATAAGAAAAQVVGAGERMPRMEAVLELMRNASLNERWSTIRDTALATIAQKSAAAET
jgi:sugar/nucleoside kinase (ribokinase family)